MPTINLNFKAQFLIPNEMIVSLDDGNKHSPLEAWPPEPGTAGGKGWVPPRIFSMPLEKFSAEQLELLCTDFRKRVFDTVKKRDPADECLTKIELWKDGHGADAVKKLLQDIRDHLDGAIIYPDEHAEVDACALLIRRIDNLCGG